jgi:hypothetical protein
MLALNWISRSFSATTTYPYGDSTRSKITIKKVATGPRNKDATHQSKPLRFLLCARPALIKDNVPQPTKNCAWPFIELLPQKNVIAFGAIPPGAGNLGMITKKSLTIRCGIGSQGFGGGLIRDWPNDEDNLVAGYRLNDAQPRWAENLAR